MRVQRFGLMDLQQLFGIFERKIMSSAIDPSVPTEGTATTESVRENFQAAKDEIEALQAAIIPSSKITKGNVASLNYASGADVTVAHGLGRAPDFVHAYAEVITAFSGWNVGDRLTWPLWNIMVYGYDATNVYLACSANVSTTMIPKAGGATVAQNPTALKLVVVPYKYD